MAATTYKVGGPTRIVVCVTIETYILWPGVGVSLGLGLGLV